MSVFVVSNLISPIIKIIILNDKLLCRYQYKTTKSLFIFAPDTLYFA